MKYKFKYWGVIHAFSFNLETERAANTRLRGVLKQGNIIRIKIGEKDDAGELHAA